MDVKELGKKSMGSETVKSRCTRKTEARESCFVQRLALEIRARMCLVREVDLGSAGEMGDWAMSCSHDP